MATRSIMAVAPHLVGGGRANARAQGALAGLRPIAAALLAIAGSALILFYFHDQYWWGPDEGAYAHVAQRVLHGEVLNRDVQDMHAGYVNLLNAAVFRLFGEDLLSLRYPLVALGIVQAFLVFLLVRERGSFLAAAAAVVLTALSFVQYLNPTANWYGLFLAILITWLLAAVDRERPLALETIGFLLVTLFLFRQITGVFVAMGALTWLLLTAPTDQQRTGGRVAPALLLVMAAGLAGYLLRKSDPLDLLLFGIWPLAILIRAVRHVRMDDRAALRLVMRLAIGGAVGLVPMTAYHLWHGSLAIWFDDMVGAALALSAMPFTERPIHAAMIMLAIGQITALGSLATVLNAMLWLGLMALPVANGVLAFRAFAQRDANAAHPLLLMAVFHALVSAFHQIPIYLFYSSGLSLAAFIWTTAAFGPRWRIGSAAMAAALAVIALQYQAAQAGSRVVREVTAGLYTGARVPSGLPRVSLDIDAADAAAHRHVLALIEREVPEDGAILAVPFEPQLYFISGRRNPVRFYNTAIGLRDEETFRDTLAILERDPPRLLLHRPEDKYNTDFSRRLMDALKPRYALIEQHEGLDIYKLR